MTLKIRHILTAFLTIAVLSLTSGCKKQIRKAQENLVLDVMTSGTWVVTLMQEGSTNTTTSFNGYEFQFYRNRTVDAIKNGVKVQSGIWESKEDQQSIVANFDAGGDALLPKLNGTWLIYSVSLTTVKSTQTKSAMEWKLDLAKK